MTPMSGMEGSENAARRYESLVVQVAPDGRRLADTAANDAAGVIGAAVASRRKANVMLATGNSQLELLAALTGRPDVEWGRVRIFHMDEYVGLRPDHPAGFALYIRDRVVSRVEPMDAFYIRSTDLAGAPAECERYAGLLRRYPLDLCVMGIGENGHLAFNDPGVADFGDPAVVKVVALDDACRRQQVGEGHFPTVDDVPTHAITVTIPGLLSAGRVIVVCPEARKAAAVGRALTGPIDETCPASILRRQGHARLYLDPESGKALN